MELLAPAGNFDCLRSAVDSGADAVYFAGRQFGARSFAGNLTEEEIFAAVDYCHLFGVRAYVTVNTLMFDREFKAAEKFIKILTKAGVDGVIVQDLGMLDFIGKLSPDIELHASTQMTVHSADGVKQLEKMGVSRVVLSRELSEKEIRYISDNTNAELEVFVHGAMCMSYSGQCLMSSVIGGRSGNRGKCAQPCRMMYSPAGLKNNQKPGQYLSLKDMSLAEHITSLKDIGVASLKIEGRMKGPEYVSTVIGIYRHLIDENRKPNKNEIEKLNNIFNRGGLTDGYFTGKTGKMMFAFDRPDNPYLKNEGAELPKPKTRPVKIYGEFAEGDYPKLKMEADEIFVEVKGDNVCQTAANKPMTEDTVSEKLNKLGGTPFFAEETEVKISGAPYMPVSEINDLRRRAVEALKQAITAPYKSKRFIKSEDCKNNSAYNIKDSVTEYSCSIMNIKQYRQLIKCKISRIYVPLHIAEENLTEIKEDLLGDTEVVISLPAVISDSLRESYKKRMAVMKSEGFKFAEVSTIDGFGMLDGFVGCGSFRLNITNNYSAERAAGLGVDSLCLSSELTAPQIRDINGFRNSNCKKEVVGYGRIPLMTTKNCITYNMDGCPCDSDRGMRDRTGRVFPLTKDGDICASVVLNAYTLYLADKAEVLDKLNADLIRLIFTDESPKDCVNIYNEYKTGKISGESLKKVKNGEFTRLQMLKTPLE